MVRYFFLAQNLDPDPDPKAVKSTEIIQNKKISAFFLVKFYNYLLGFIYKR